MSFLRHYLIAVRLFTRVPVTGTLARWVGFSPEMLRASAGHFPGVGWLVGFVACVVFALLGSALPDSDLTGLAAAVGSTIATVLLTGGAHENALAHTAEGLRRGAGAGQATAIMGETGLGGFGAMALALALLAKISLLGILAARSPVAVLAALFAGHVVSRFWPLLLVRGMRYVGAPENAKDAPLAERIGARDLGIALAWCAVALLIALLSQDLAFASLGLVGSGLALAWMQRLLARRLQGFSGETLGATQQVCEVGFYLGAAIGVGVG